MTIRRYAESVGFKVVGKLKRLPDVEYGFGSKYPVWEDEAGNCYMGSYKNYDYCIVTADGGVL